jgi:hypothetical protein
MAKPPDRTSLPANADHPWSHDHMPLRLVAEGDALPPPGAALRVRSQTRRINFMTTNLKYWVLATALAIGIGGPTLRADDTKDYSKSKQYQQGVKEGQYDHAHNLDHSKKRHFKKDEDQQAYEQGYQKSIVVVVK